MRLSTRRLALRLAWRTARRSPGRTALVAALVGLPVLAASAVSIVATSTDPTGEALVNQVVGKADAVVVVAEQRPVKVFDQMATLESAHYEAAQGSIKQDPTTVDVAARLPAGSRVTLRPEQANPAELRVGDIIGSYPVTRIDGNSQISAGMFRLDSGRLPSKPDEVALSPKLAKHLGLLDGDRLADGATVVDKDGRRYRAVGLAARPGERMLWATPGSNLAPIQPSPEQWYLVDLPAGADPLALQRDLAKHGLVLTPRSWIVTPPGGGVDGPRQFTEWAVVALVAGFGVLEIVLLAGTAFAVGARRQARELGLVTATGGRPTDVRRIVLAQGLVLGLVGAVTGIGLAVAVAVLGRSYWETVFRTVILDWVFPIRALLTIGAIGVLAGLAAAIVPAISAGRQTPMAALTGRTRVAQGRTRIRRLAVGLVAVGVAAVLAGSSLLAAAYAEQQRLVQDSTYPSSGVTPTGPIALVIVGITAVLTGLIWMLPSLIGKTAGFGRHLPLSARLALRDAARHRHRTGPATAAIMMSVGGTVALSFAIVNAFAAEAENYIPAGHRGDAVVGIAVDPTVHSGEKIDQAQRLLPVQRRFDVTHVLPRNAKPGDEMAVEPEPCRPDAVNCYAEYPWLRAVSSDYVARFGAVGKQVAAELSAGKVVLLGSAGRLSGGQVRLSTHGLPVRLPALPAVRITGLPVTNAFNGGAVISPETARKLGSLQPFETHFQLTRPPTEDELAAVDRVFDREDAIAVEAGYQSPARMATLVVLGVATLVTLLGVAIAVALSAAEGRSDLATLAAVGAQPRRRRNLAAAQAWVLGQLGCLLGVGVGGLYGYTAHAALGSPHFAVPWWELAGIVVAIPLFAGLLAWLITRSRLPMIRRIG